MQMEESERATLQSTLNARPINTKKKESVEEDAEQDCWGIYRVWLR
ncbi:hypothetical protein PC113_g14682 [Phytophthora cactorum]|uniref:Uncharacterized protein n=1 Tax=Phytophthora cactorum TaxID=29920 RepID=A0A8T0YQ46_9STRA|nr:hypothetical protein PC113_g14682 [Phytophthora cactorum]